MIIHPALNMGGSTLLKVPGMAQLASKRFLSTKSRTTSSTPVVPAKIPVFKPASQRFAPAQPGAKRIVNIFNPSEPPVPMNTPALEEPPAQKMSEVLTPEQLHMYDSISVNGWRFLFPRGQCPKKIWWRDRAKPWYSSVADLRWTSGMMYRYFRLRVSAVLAVTGISSTLLANAVVLEAVNRMEGPVSTVMRVSIFAAVVLPGLTYGIYRSRIIPEVRRFKLSIMDSSPGLIRMLYRLGWD